MFPAAAIARSSPAYSPLLPLAGRGRAPLPLRPGKAKVSRRGVVTAQIELKPPPYSLSSLEPYLSRQTLEHHWGRHHRSHVESLNMQILGTELDGLPLEDIIVASYNRDDPLPAFNNAAQIWNHDFFWQSMKPDGGGLPSGDLLRLIKRDFGSFELLLGEFKRAACTQFGSGWAWLTYKANRLNVGNSVNPYPSDEDNKLVVAKTPNAVNPLVWDYSIWNHDFFWQSMKPGGGGLPSGDLLRLIKRDFGSFELLLGEFKRAACMQFGSGWAWLTYKANSLNVGNSVNPYPSDEDNKLVIAKTPNAVNPLVWDYYPLLGIDLWEHAHYLDYEDERADYVSIFLEKLVSWDMVSSRLEMAMTRAMEREKQDDTRREEDEEDSIDNDTMEMYLDSENEESENE